MMVTDRSIQKFGRTEEVIALAMVLAFDKASYITGVELTFHRGIPAGSAALRENDKGGAPRHRPFLISSKSRLAANFC